MSLKEFIKTVKEDICILMFDENGNVLTKMYSKGEFRNIPKYLLEKEYMESEETDDCLEVWIK